MNVNVSKDNKTTLIEVSGRIDSTNANELGEALMTEINGGEICNSWLIWQVSII